MRLKGNIAGKSSQVKAGIVGFVNVVNNFIESEKYKEAEAEVEVEAEAEAEVEKIKIEINETDYDIYIDDNKLIDLLKYYYGGSYKIEKDDKIKYYFYNYFIPNVSTKNKTSRESYSRLRMAVYHGSAQSKKCYFNFKNKKITLTDAEREFIESIDSEKINSKKIENILNATEYELFLTEDEYKKIEDNKKEDEDEIKKIKIDALNRNSDAILKKIKRVIFSEEDLKKIIPNEINSLNDLKKNGSHLLGSFELNSDNYKVTYSPEDIFLLRFSMVGCYLFLMQKDMVVCVPDISSLEDSCNNLQKIITESFARIICPQEGIIRTNKVFFELLNKTIDFVSYDYYLISNVQSGYKINISGRSDLNTLLPTKEKKYLINDILKLNNWNFKTLLANDFFKNKNIIHSLLSVINRIRKQKKEEDKGFVINRIRKQKKEKGKGFVINKFLVEDFNLIIERHIMKSQENQYQKDLENYIRAKLCSKQNGSKINWDRLRKDAYNYFVRLKSVRNENAFRKFFNTLVGVGGRMSEESFRALFYDLDNDYEKVKTITGYALMFLSSAYPKKKNSDDEIEDDEIEDDEIEDDEIEDDED